MNPVDAIEVLRQVNGKLRSAIERFRPEKNACLTMQAEDLSRLLADLVHAGESLRAASDDVKSRPEWEQERSGYLSNLEELERLLPDFHRRVLAERARLISARDHLDAAAAWAGTNQIF